MRLAETLVRGQSLGVGKPELEPDQAVILIRVSRTVYGHVESPEDRRLAGQFIELRVADQLVRLADQCLDLVPRHSEADAPAADECVGLSR